MTLFVRCDGIQRKGKQEELVTLATEKGRQSGVLDRRLSWVGDLLQRILRQQGELYTHEPSKGRHSGEGREVPIQLLL